jgi:putative glycosyltransferase
VKLSVVTTLYNTSDFLSEFLSKVSSLQSEIAIDSYEFILVDDGSTEAQYLEARLITATFENTVLIRLSRNFGHHQALLEGLEQATGDLIFLIDSDLEEDPLDFSLLYSEMLRTNADLVYGYQENRRGGLLERLSGRLFYFFMNKFMKVEIPDNMLTSRLMSRRYLDALLLHTETQINFSGLSIITGFNQAKVSLKKTRLRKTTYSLSRKVSILIDAVTSFSTSPLKLIFGTGVVIFTASVIVTLWLLIESINNGNPTSGWASLILSIWFLGGMNMLSLGIIGVYISRIFMETKRRPRVIISEVFRSNEVL